MASDGTVEYSKESLEFRKADTKNICMTVMNGPESGAVFEFRPGRDVQAINVRAEHALRKAKQMGRNRIEISTKDLWKRDDTP